jgi:hypothetical protein
MPNYVENDLVVTGDQADLAKFVASVAGIDVPITFNAVIPCPEHLAGFNDTGWCSANWGTKWDAINPHAWLDEHETQWRCSFETAWEPPLKVVQRMASMWPALSFELNYYEQGMEFRGTWVRTHDSENRPVEREERVPYIGIRGG